MTIDLSNPIVIGVSITVISAIILGSYHYVRTLVQLNFTDKKLSNILSELDSLHKDYKKEIAEIKKHHSDELERAIDRVIDRYEKKMDTLLEHNKPQLYDLKTLSDAYFKRKDSES